LIHAAAVPDDEGPAFGSCAALTIPERPAMIHRHLSIIGRVQGVTYRAWMIEQAESLGITGWVRNRADGSVEAVVAGPAEQVDALLARVQHGPPGARVTGVDVTEAPAAVHAGFVRRATV
jgi:acylphosphatase